MYEVIRTTDYLEHHGIKGMKWGVRRYQNEDGSLTPAGERRYGTNLDINDKSRSNIAKIRLGEARRRLDVAKQNSETKGKNDYRVAEMRKRVKSAKKVARRQAKYDRGAELVAKGRSKMGNDMRGLIATGLGVIAKQAWTQVLETRLNTLSGEGRISPAHENFAVIMKLAGDASIGAAVGAYHLHLQRQNSDMRAYNRAHWTGQDSITRVGSQEYKDVVKRRRENS